MATYTGYTGPGTGVTLADPYWASWHFVSGDIRSNCAHNMCMLLLTNRTYASQMGKANLGEGIEYNESAGYLHRYDPTSTAGWNSALTLGNEVPTSVVISGIRFSSANDIWYNESKIQVGICLASGAGVNASPPFMNHKVQLATISYDHLDNYVADNLSYTIPTASRMMFKNSSLWLYLNLQISGGAYKGEYNRALRVHGQMSVTVYTTARPTVSIGSTITKTQMDNLRSWKSTIGINSTAVTQGSPITAAVGNTYRATGGGGTRIDASWYNTD